MARVRFLRDVSAIWMPQLAPWRASRVLICETPGTALPAETPFEFPDELAYTALHDFPILFGSDVEFLTLPATDVLVSQRQQAVALAPHVLGVSVPLPGENDDD